MFKGQININFKYLIIHEPTAGNFNSASQNTHGFYKKKLPSFSTLLGLLQANWYWFGVINTTVPPTEVPWSTRWTWAPINLLLKAIRIGSQIKDVISASNWSKTNCATIDAKWCKQLLWANGHSEAKWSVSKAETHVANWTLSSS